MRRRDRIGIGLALAVFLGLIAWWLYYVPYTPSRLFRAVPAHAALLSMHRGLPDRWEDLSANPIARSLFRSLGADPDEMAAITQDPTLAVLLDQLAGQDVVLAFVPSLGPGGGPAWVASSWIGGKSHQLRWLAPLLEIEGLKRYPLEDGHTLWTVDEAAFERELQPSIAVLEGMLVCCLASDPAAMQAVLDCYDGVQPSMAGSRGETPQLEWLLENENPDRGWALPGALAVDLGPDGDVPVYFEFTSLTADRIRGRLEREAEPAAPLNGGPLAEADLARVLGDLPLAVVTLRRDLADLALEAWPSPWSTAAARAMTGLDAPHVSLALLGGEYSGRFKGIRVPSMVLAMQMDDPQAVLPSVHAALDHLNAAYQLGAIPKATGSGTGSVYRIDASQELMYGRLSNGEKAGFAGSEDWLVLGSNSAALDRLMQRYRDPGSDPASAPPRWAEEAGPGVAGSAWLNLEQGGKTAKLALTAYSLKLLFSGSDEAADALEAISEAKVWIDALSSLKVGRLVLVEKDRRVQLDFDVGP